ncbi:hypothetical protein [Deinococcus planocerae]|uniref:hypothetical protein n=1 Tax=Deinococcus planocerae TaxID=1737569 RepID=UPI0015E0816F|nr:hypothetical protein [Deinococcus planocerae]
MPDLTGHLHGLGRRSGLRLSGGPDHLTGRLGGASGKDLTLRVEGKRVTGRVGGHLIGTDVRATLRGHTLVARVGGRFMSVDLTLTSGSGRVTGRWGGLLGFDVDLAVTGDGVRGRLGGRHVGADAALEGDARPLLLALVAALAYAELRQDD